MSRTCKRWSENEDEIIRSNYPGHGPYWEKWAEVLPGRTTHAIRMRASKLGAVHRSPKAAVPAAKEDAGERPWTRKQRRALVLAFATTECATGHTAAECSLEMARLLAKSGGRGGDDHE